MTTTAYHTLRSYTPTASAEASGYPDDNLALRPVRRSWRSGALSGSPWTVKLDLGSALATTAILVWDTNIPASGIVAAHSDDYIAFTNLATVTVGANSAGRRYALIPTAVTKRYFRLTITAASTSDGANYVEIGRVAIFASSGVYAFTNPLSVNTTYHSVRSTLLNGRVVTAYTGEPYAEITMVSNGFNYGTYAQDTLRELFATGPVGLDLDCFGAFLAEEGNDQFQRQFTEGRGDYQYVLNEVV